MVAFSKRVTRATRISFGSQSKASSRTNFHLTVTAIAAISADLISGDFLEGNPYQIREEEIQTQNTALIPYKWVEFKLQETARVTHNTQLLRFSFDPTKTLGLDAASCILTRARLGQDSEEKPEYTLRLYTPISDPESKGYFDLLIKVRPKGKMSQHFANLKPGDVVEMVGPIGRFRYTPNMKKNIGMIAGETGITPMIQVIQTILKNSDDKTQISLLYASVSPDDILLKEKLDILATSHPNLKIFYTVDNPTENWKGGVGYISKDMVQKGLPGPSDDTLILVCGPTMMMRRVCGERTGDFRQGELIGIMENVGYTKQMVYKF